MSRTSFRASFLYMMRICRQVASDVAPRFPVSFIRSGAFLLFVVLAVGACEDKPTTGALVVNVTGLPTAAPAAVRVSGPGSFSKQVNSSTTLEGLPPGEYTVSVETVHYTNALYTSQTTSETHTVTAGHTESAAVTYELSSGMVDIHVSGLPQGVAPSLLVIGTGFSKTVLSDGIVGELPPGTYELRADPLFSGDGDRFSAEKVSQPFSVSASLTPVVMSVIYAISSGSLTVNLSGLPDGLSARPVTVTGPGTFSRTIAVSTTYRGLDPGTYTISAVKATGVCPDFYTPDVTSQTASVSTGATAGASVNFAHAQVVAGNLNLKVDQLHMVQVVQDYEGKTPLVAGKPALLRVFGIANQCNFATPKMRITISGGASIDRTTVEPSVREASDQGILQSSWNVIVPGEIVQPGMTVTAVIDPDNVVAESDETDNTLSKAIDVRTVPTVGLRFVPVTVAGATGNVSTARVDDMLALSRKIHPVLAYDADVAPAFTATGIPLGADDGNGWGRVLGDLEAKRIADLQGPNPSERYYVGIVKVSYNSGIAGIGFVGGKSTLNWDYLPSASGVIAHELGHNYGRQHTPCGGPAGIDQNYPTSGSYANGFIGQFGYDFANEVLKPPTQFSDIMGYCGSQWISDYTYFFMMQWITTHGATLPTIASAAQLTGAGQEVPSLLVWGRIANGQPILEPAFELSARPELPPAGANRLVGLDDSGAEIFALPFAANRIADLPGDNQSFAFAIPVSMLRGRSLAELSLTSGGRTVRSRASGATGVDAQTIVTQVGPRVARVQWDATRFPAVMVRDVATGQVIAFARGGDASIVTSDTGRDLELVFSNRVRSARVVRRLR